jgi:hypothetical protein
VLDNGRLLSEEKELYYHNWGLFYLILGVIILGIFLIRRVTITSNDYYIYEYLVFISLLLIMWIGLGGYCWDKIKSHILVFAIHENGIHIITLDFDYFISFKKIKKHKLKSIGKDRWYFQIESGDSWKIIIGNHPSINGINFISKNIDAMDSIINNRIKKND